MKMIRFRVQNYKKVQDTDWISCDDLTAFVGKNEAGKSALFRGLSKLNPSDGEKYNGLKEFPRRRYVSEFSKQDYPVASIEFELSDVEKSELEKNYPFTKGTEKVCCTRYYSWNLDVKFEPEPNLPDVSNSAFLSLLEESLSQVQSLSAPEGKGEILGTIKTSLIETVEQMKGTLTTQPSNQQANQSQVDTIVNAFSTHSNENWQQEILQPIITRFQEFNNSLKLLSEIAEAKVWVEKNIPIFIYFDRYDVIDSAVHIMNFAQQIQENPSAPRVRATKCLFEHAGLDINDILNLDPNKPDQSEETLRNWADERAIKMSSASNAMTEKFSDWWEQRKHKFHYQLDGPFFRVWVSDDLDPSEIELDQRSLGLQYFFSFYVVFLVESTNAHHNSVLLLDEAGLHMHGTAQGKVVKFLEKVSEQNQTLYTTHSPFMIDGDHLGRIRVVYESEDGTTTVSEDVWPKDKDALFPLQAALGYSIAQTLFYAKRQVLVEGITDYWIFKAINEKLLKKGMTGLLQDLILVPAGGVNNLIPLASMLVGHDIEIAAILDGDEPGRRKGKQLQDKLLSDKAGRCVFIGDYVHTCEAELEDLFPEDYYMKAVSESYDFELNFTDEEMEIQNIAKRFSTAFKRLGIGEFEKWRPARVILDWIGKDENIPPQETLELFSKILQAVNTPFVTMEKNESN
jgi:predicted ATP-dependent endonuclease of OLD family